MKAVLYRRVSTEEQSAHGVSLDAQEERMRQYAIFRGLEVAAIYTDAGVSGSVLLRDRPAGLELLAGLERGEATAVVVVAIDRLGRDAMDLLGLVRDWSEAGIGLHVIESGIVDTATYGGFVQFGLSAVLAHAERIRISERIRAAMLHMKRAGAKFGGPAFGEVRAPDARGKGTARRENPEQLAVIVRMAEMHEAGYSFRQIASKLAEEGVRTARGGTWAHPAVAKILRRYLGQSKAGSGMKSEDLAGAAK